MSLHTEINFENDICAHLVAHGWLYAEGDALAGYDTPRALFAPDVIAWVQATQPQAWESLDKSHGAAAQAMLLDRLRKQLDERGTLDVLRFGVEMLGLRQSLKLAQFKPALAMNPDLQTRYAANCLRVVRQVRTNHNDVIDIVLFLNGIPVATAEVKTDFTQDVNQAVDQYRFDRHPKPKGKTSAEPLLDFPRGALVHFAVSNSSVFMTTRLQGPGTQFLPFNLGDHGAAGNPVNLSGHRTAYLWEQVWQRDSWLEIIGRYLVTQRDSRKQITGMVPEVYASKAQLRTLQRRVKAWRSARVTEMVLRFPQEARPDTGAPGALTLALWRFLQEARPDMRFPWRFPCAPTSCCRRLVYGSGSWRAAYADNDLSHMRPALHVRQRRAGILECKTRIDHRLDPVQHHGADQRLKASA